MKTLIALRGVSSHIIWPLEVWLVLYFLQDLVHRLPKHSINYLGSSRPSMPRKISLRLIIVVPLQSKIPSVLRNYFNLPLSLMLILFDPFILINSIYELTYTPNRLSYQRLP